jgi:hypothetical protein
VLKHNKDNRIFSLPRKDTTVYAVYLDVYKISNTSCNYLRSFFIEKLSLKMHLINKKTAVHTIDPPYNVIGDC